MCVVDNVATHPYSSPMKSPGDLIKNAREAKQISQNALAEQAALPHSSISRFENNKRALTIEAVHTLSTLLTDSDEAYRELSSSLVHSTCNHFGTERRKHLASSDQSTDPDE